MYESEKTERHAMIDKANIRRNLSRLMAAKSISGTAEEIQGAEVILDMLYELDSPFPWPETRLGAISWPRSCAEAPRETR